MDFLYYSLFLCKNQKSSLIIRSRKNLSSKFFFLLPVSEWRKELKLFFVLFFGGIHTPSRHHIPEILSRFLSVSNRTIEVDFVKHAAIRFHARAICWNVYNFLFCAKNVLQTMTQPCELFSCLWSSTRQTTIET